VPSSVIQSFGGIGPIFTGLNGPSGLSDLNTHVPRGVRRPSWTFGSIALIGAEPFSSVKVVKR
jgi:hypothetical protein